MHVLLIGMYCQRISKTEVIKFINGLLSTFPELCAISCDRRIATSNDFTPVTIPLGSHIRLNMKVKFPNPYWSDYGYFRCVCVKSHQPSIQKFRGTIS